MAKQYSCELCEKVFTQSSDLKKHQKKKSPCISIDKIQELHQTKVAETDSKTKLSVLFNYCLDVLRNSEHLTGDKALRTLAHLLDLRLLEQQFDSQINIDNYEYDFTSYEEDIIEEHKTKLLRLVRFSNLVKENEDNIPTIMKCLWDEILSVHPVTKNIFLKGKGFDIQYQSTYKKIIDKLYSFDFESIDEDILGEAYEEVIKDVMTGKVLGQFFTPPRIKQLMVRLVDPQLNTDGTIEKIFDPAMGTGGFLITALRHLLHQSKTKRITMNWDYISNEGLGGREAESDTYQLAISNMLISSGRMFNVLEKGDSIRNPITNKYDIIFANPPFGIDGLIYNEILHPLRNEYMPITSNSAVPLFLQAIIYMLKINGRCAIVLPYGKELQSKTSNLAIIREYLMKTCDLKEVIYLPAGIFTNTPIKTCILYFIKKQECDDVLEIDVKISKTTKTQKENRCYNFSKTHQTRIVKFYDYNAIQDTKVLLLEVSIEKIQENSYSLNHTQYIIDEPEEYVEEDITIQTLGELCNFLPKSKRNAKYGNESGLFPFFKSSIKVDSYVDEPDYEEESLIIGDGGEANINYGIRFSTSDHCYILQNKNKLILNLKYSYYYLFHNLIIMKQLYTGVGIKNISKSSIERIKIPIPSLRQQERIVKYLDFIYEKSIKTSNEKIADLKMANEFYLNNQLDARGVVLRQLCEISRINPENMKFHQYTEINYIDIASVKGSQILELQKLTSDFPSRAKRVIKKGDILYSSVRPNLKGYVYIDENIQNCIASTGFAVIRTKEPTKIMSKYLYYVMTCENITNYLISKATGAQYPAVSFDDFETINIPVPSLKRQQEIVEYCENNDRLIQQLKTEIETNKREAQRFIKSVVKLDSEDDDDINDNINCEEENDDEEQADENEYVEEEGEEEDDDEDEEDVDEEDVDEEDVDKMITNFKFTSDKISSDLHELVNGFTQDLMKLVMDKYKKGEELQNEVEYPDEE
jgi:type I restriction-modification system DNA methylase subunit/restriction endonuclease S subunit